MSTSNCGTSAAELLLDHGLGFSRIPHNLADCGVSVGPSGGSPVVASPCGKVILVSDLDDCHNQLVIRGHETNITSLDACHAAGVGTWCGISFDANGQPSSSSSSNHNTFTGRLTSSPGADAGTTLGCVIATGHRASSDGVAYLNIWSAATGDHLRAIRTPHRGVLSKGPNRNGDRAPAAGANDGYIAAVKFSPDGALVATVGNEGSLAVFDCAGGTKVAGFQETMESTQAISLVWGRCENVGTRDQRYAIYVPFTTGVRLFTLQFSVKTLTYELIARECQVPGGGGRMGGFQRTFLSCATAGNDLLCGASSGELLVFNVQSGSLRAGLQLCQHGIAAIAVPAAANDDPNAERVAFIAGGDGTVRRVIGRDSQWRVQKEVSLPARVLGMVLSSEENQHPSSYRQEAEVFITTTSGHMYRMLTSDLSYTVATDGPTGNVTCVVTPSAPRHQPADQRAPVVALDELTTCSTDGWVRLWDLNTFTVRAAFAHPTVVAALHQAASSTLITSSGNGYAPGAGGSASQGNGVSRKLREIHGALLGGGAAAKTTAAGDVVLPTVAAIASSSPSGIVLVVGFTDGSLSGLFLPPPTLPSNDRVGAERFEELWAIKSAHSGPIKTIDVSDIYVVTGGPGGVVRVWGWNTLAGGSSAPNLVAQMQDHRGEVSGVRVDDCVSCLIHTVGIADQSHRIYDLSQNQPDNNFRTQQTGFKHTGAPLPHQQRNGVLHPAAVGTPRCVRVHTSGSITTQQPPQKQYASTTGTSQSPSASGGAILALTQRFDGDREAVVGTADGRVLMLDIDDDGTARTAGKSTVIPSPGPAAGPACAVAVTPYFRWGNVLPLVAVGHADGTIVVYALPTTKGAPSTKLHTSFAHTAQVTALTWSADGKQLFSAGSDGELFVWNMFW